MELQGELIYFVHEFPADQREILLVPIGDIHLGNPLFSEPHLDKTLKFVADNPNAYILLMGDLCEMAVRDSKGDIFRQVLTPQKQMEWIVEKFMPYKDRILGMTSGNHEDRISQRVGVDICGNIALQLGVPYRQEGIMLKLIMPVKKKYKNLNNKNKFHPHIYLYATHGWGGARTMGAKLLKVSQVADYFERVNLFIMAHDHQFSAADKVKMYPGNTTFIDEITGFRIGRMKEEVIKIMKCNAFLKRGGYSERLGFPPVDLGISYARVSLIVERYKTAKNNDYGEYKTQIQIIG